MHFRFPKSTIIWETTVVYTCTSTRGTMYRVVPVLESGWFSRNRRIHWEIESVLISEKQSGRSFLIDSWMISVRDQPESQYMSGSSSRTTVFLAKRASTSDADGPKAFPYQVSATESYWSSQETSATTFLTLLSKRRRAKAAVYCGGGVGICAVRFRRGRSVRETNVTS